MGQKLKIATYGACHASAIREMLVSAPDADRYISARFTRGCHEIPEEEFDEFCDDLKNYDVLIYQPISSAHRGEKLATARLLKNVRPDANVLSFQYFHFELYTPFMLEGIGGLTAPPFSYLDYHLAVMIARGLPDVEIIDRLENEDCLSPFVDQINSFCFSNLREREARVLPGEKELDVKISDFVEENFRNQRLSYTYNHPTKAVLDNILAQVSELDPSMRAAIDAVPSDGVDPLSAMQFPVPKFVQRAFGLTFQGADGYTINGQPLSVEEYVSVSRPHFVKEGSDKILAAVEMLSTKRPWYGSLLSI